MRQTKIATGYPGNKGSDGVYQRIINEIPPHKKYVELFLGSGQVLRHKLPAVYGSVGVEIDTETIQSQEWEMLTQYYNLVVVPRCSIEWLEQFSKGITSDTFIYADPPYPLSSRRDLKDLYRHEMTDKQHIEFLTLAKKTGCSIAISTYENELYSKMLKDWRCIKYKVATRAGVATESLYMNYDEPKQLHDYRYLGKDFIDRQRIKRKIKRHIDKLLALPALERSAICHAIETGIIDIG